MVAEGTRAEGEIPSLAGSELSDADFGDVDRPYFHADNNPIDVYAEFEDSHWWFLARRRILRQLVERALEGHPARRIVDVGCGPGANIASLSGDCSCVGVDISGEAIKIARARHQNVEFVHGLAPADVPEAVATADLLLLTDVLEHVRDPGRMLRELVHASSPGAHILVTVPAGPELWSEHDRTVGHRVRYTSDTFRGLWSGLPVDERMISYFNTYLYPAAWGGRWLSRRRARTAGHQGTDLSMPPAPINWLLTRIFALEARALIQTLEGHRRGFRRGVSLVALLRRVDSPA